MKKTKSFALAVALLTTSLVIPQQSTVQAATDDPQYAEACPAGWAYRNASKTNSLYFSKTTSGTHYINKTGSNLTYTSSISGSYTAGATASGSLGGGWGPISATVGYTANTSYAITASDSVTITVRPHYEGWNDYGTKRDKWTGYYVYLSSNCPETSGSNITITSPRAEAVVSNEVYANY
jgi:hypothetical protein